MTERLREQLVRIRQIVERARETGPPMWPMNEANTERLIVEPVLRALGYDELDYCKRVQGAGANFPDYTVLPGSAQQWILEAKEWETRLEERFERQAVNYANNNGAQWAVLTNGRVWWVYNTRVAGDLTQQRVYELGDILETEHALEVLPYLSRTSIEAGELDRAYRAREIRSALVAELRSGNRQIVNALRQVVGRSLDRHVSTEDVVEVLATILPDETPITVSQPAAPPSKVSGTPTGDPSWVSLAHLAGDPTRTSGLRPLVVRFANGQEEEVETWRDAVVAVVLHSCLLDAVAVPLLAGPRAGRFFINHKPVHSDGRDMKAPREVRWNSRVYYVEMHYSAYNLMMTLSWSLRQAGLDPSTIEMHVGASE